MNDIFVLTREELETLDYSVFMHIPVTFHAHKIKKYLDGIAESSENPKEKKLASLFGMLYSFNLQVVNNTPSFEPQMIWGNKRSILPEDFDEQVNDCLLYVSQKITNPFLLSRIYDVVWCNNRKNKDVAIKAIDSYAEMLNIAIEKLIIKNESMDESDLIALFLLVIILLGLCTLIKWSTLENQKETWRLKMPFILFIVFKMKD